MTKSLETKLAERRGARTRKTIFGRIAERLRAHLGTSGVWPMVQYQKDPVGFARDVLGYTPCRTVEDVVAEVERAKTERRKAKILWKKQIDILEALIPANATVAVRSGQKTGKSKTAAILALWFYCCFPEARAMFTANAMKQVERVLWRELSREHEESKMRLDGELAKKPETGLKGAGRREVTGATAKHAEAVSGFSDPNILYIVDEASGIDEHIFDAIEGNRAAGARLVMFSQGTRTSGRFFDAFHKHRELVKRIHISSLETPNVVTGRELIPGLAGREWVERNKQQYGERSVFWIVRVLGDFALHDEKHIVSMHTITQAVARWKQLEEDRTPDEGRLSIGLDPAGPGAGGDETVFAPRRGQRLLQLYRFSGQSEDAILVQLLGIIATHKKRPREDEIPIVILDRSGPIGIKVARVIRAYLDANPNAFELRSVVSSDKSMNAVVRCDRVRDELWFRLSEWFAEGAAIPEDARLEKELHAPQWYTPPGRDVIKATPKDELRKLLDGKSPDSADALALSVWESGAPDEALPRSPAKREEDRRPVLDPYAGQIDPYGWDR